MDEKVVSETVATDVSRRLRSRRRFLGMLATAAGAAGLAALSTRRLKADLCDGNFACDQNYHCTSPITCKGFTQTCTPPYKYGGEEEEDQAQ